MKYTKIFKTYLKLDVDNSEFANNIKEFLDHSNRIEQEYSKEALEDAKNAWEWAFLNKDQHIGIQYIKKVHYLLMNRIRPDIAGKFRKCDVFIGGKRKLYISDELMEVQLLDEVCDKMNNPLKNSELGCKIVHVNFEEIHPFEDGNGRVGRILYNIHRIKEGLPIHIIHEGSEQRQYYLWFQLYDYERRKKFKYKK